MSGKRNEYNRTRNVVVAFRVKPKEGKLIDNAIQLSGQTKQDYLLSRALNREVNVQGNPRVYKALRNRLDAVYAELCRIEAGTGVDPDLLAIIRMMAEILDGLKGGSE